jgi:hypothetical protein
MNMQWIRKNMYKTALVFITAGLLGSCRGKEEKSGSPLFTLLSKEQTGVDFVNKLSFDQSFNLFKYIYFYNGSGVGAGDFNNDGLQDLFFGSNQGASKLFLNKGKLRFADVTTAAVIPADGGWTTGVSVVDINQDGLLDIYVCRVGNYETLHSRNQLLINQGVNAEGIPVFADKAAEYGLDFSGFCTQAAFFDYDLDGDLDLFLLNHSVHQNGTFKPRAEFTGQYHELSGDRFYKNDKGRFTDVTRETGIYSSAIGYGLGIAIADINLDGYPDIYIGNDFHENDYLYINQKNGTFSEQGTSELMHTSQFSMGVDVADVNNDAYPEIISTDMLPADPYILKRSLGEDSYDIFFHKISVGYSYQYTRNNLQYNQRNGHFSETGLYSGVAATDWSWAALWMDFDNDGRKDLFISNGIPKRMNDIDYVNFVSNTEVPQRINTEKAGGRDLSLISKFPEIRIPNKFFLNKGDMSFADMADRIKGDLPGFSNGAVYADLDNDGDLDVVVNNIDAPVFIYENNRNEGGARTSVSVKPVGQPGNKNAIGARAVIFSGKEVQVYEKYPVRGFLSSMETPLLIGLSQVKADSAFWIWPDNTYEPLMLDTSKGQIELTYKPGLPAFDLSRIRNRNKPEGRNMLDITAASGLNYVHRENHFVEFDREPLIPHMVSTEGPAAAVADINGDGLDDIFLGGARNQQASVFVQHSNGRFAVMPQPALLADSVYEDVDACWADVNNDTYPDLLVASGGNEFYGKDFHNTPRLYLGSASGLLTRKTDAFDSLYLTASTIQPCDFNGDGAVDLFIGARAVPWAYGQMPTSYLLQNDGKGHFTNVTDRVAPELATAGFVTQALWTDIDKDGDQDLLLALEWGPVTAYINQQGRFTRRELTVEKGWWNTLTVADVNNDGLPDLLAGNLGLNSRLKASTEQPVRLYYADFDHNGRKEQVLTYYLQNKEIPFANKAELEKQMPILKKKFLYAADFAKASLQELFGSKELDDAGKWSADYFSSVVLINKGNLQFAVEPLSFEAQLSPLKAAVPIDADGNNLPDFLVGGNYYGNNIEMGRYDASYGQLLINKGAGRFDVQAIPGLVITGEIRYIRSVRVGGRMCYLVVRNNASALLIDFAGK